METKLCIGVVGGVVALSPVEQLAYIKNAGFDGFFMDIPHHGDAMEFRREADRLGLYFQSIHAPFYGAAHMWEEGEKGNRALQELLDCIDICHTCAVGTVVVHPFIGFFDTYTPTEIGLRRFRAVADRAAACGVRVAFENVEGEELLAFLMNAFANDAHVGFCCDSGHEICYNRERDMLALYGDRLIATHINDNQGVTGERIYWTDDLHLLPFDGVKDWSDAMARLDACHYTGPMTFELKMSSDIDAKWNTDYTAISFEEYLQRAYKAAVALRDLRCK